MTAGAPEVVMFLGNTDYGSINAMTRAMADAFTQQGFLVTVIDTRIPGTTVAMEAAVGRGISFCCSMAGIGLPSGPNIEAFFTHHDIASFAYFLDPYPNVQDRAGTGMPRFAMSFTSDNQTRFLPARLNSTRPVLCLPHAASERPVTAWSGKDLDVVLVASAHSDPETHLAKVRSEHGEQVWRTCHDIIERHDALSAAGCELPFEDLIIDVLLPGRQALGLNMLISYFLTVDDVLRNRAKILAARSLGPGAVVVGRGWDSVGLAKGVTVLSEIDVAETVKLYDRARIVLNAQPPYYHSHERIFMAAAGGSVPLTTPSRPLAERVGGRFWAEFPATGPALTETITALLADDAGLEAMGAAAHAAWRDGNTWAHRARAVTDLMHRTFGCRVPGRP
jgi:hypothetical protein